ncbi:recombinase family protein [Guptibacillus hwajinpoensis]|uniref:recombinase family protein n=1 Tax=Guptibacillus hwajinpoensis TaxID=208199 RepID=UPI0026573338|nr:recombinase family protein [Alkalihalobacillus hemicentroti]
MKHLRRCNDLRIEEILVPDKRGVFYGRYSTRKQDMKMQLHSAEMLAEQYGCEITKKYLDNGISATKKKLLSREQLGNLLRDAENDKFDYVIVYSNDRLARDPVEHLYIRKIFSDHNIPVVLSNNNSFYDSGELVPQLVKDGMTKFESDNNRDRTSDTFKYKIQKGEWTGGNPPYGYYYDSLSKSLIEIPMEIEIVKTIFGLYKRGLGFQSIAKKISEDSSNLKSWTKEAVKTIITNPFYMGYMSMNKRKRNAHNSITERDEWIMGKSPLINAVIDEEEWEYCFRNYENKRKRKIPPRHYTTPYFLKELLFCKKCDCKMHPKNQKTKSSNGKIYGNKIYYCKKCSFRVKTSEIHDYVFYILVNVLITKDFMRPPDNLFSEVKKSYAADKKSYGEEIKILEGLLGESLLEMEKASLELKKNMSDKTAESRDLIDILQVYREEINNDISNYKNSINSKKKQIRHIDLVLTDFTLWNELYKELQYGYVGMEDETVFRRLAIHLLEKVYLEYSSDGSVTRHVSGNTHKGVVNNIIVDLTAKINVEATHRLDIELNFD